MKVVHDPFRSVRADVVADAAKRFDRAKEGFLRCLKNYPVWTRFMADNFDLLWDLKPHPARGIHATKFGFSGYDLGLDPQSAMEGLAHFIQHEVFDDGCPVLVWILDGEVVPPFTGGSVPCLVSNVENVAQKHGLGFPFAPLSCTQDVIPESLERVVLEAFRPPESPVQLFLRKAVAYVCKDRPAGEPKKQAPGFVFLTNEEMSKR